MKLYLASVESGQIENIKDLIVNSKYLLSSFYYLRKVQDKFIENVISLNVKNNFILDSGAFTMFGKKHYDLQGYIDDYIHFINEYDINQFIELDIDVIVGFDEVLNIRKYIEEKTKKKVIPVWHKFRGVEDYKRTIEKYSYVAIGGIVTKEIKPQEYRNFKKMTQYAKTKGAKVHGLGFTGSECYKYGFYSVDSSSWSGGRRFGKAMVFDGQKMKDEPKPKGTRGEYVAIDRFNFLEWCKFQKYVERY